MDSGQRFCVPARLMSCRLTVSRLCWEPVSRGCPTRSFHQSKNPLPRPTARGFLLCPRCVLDIEPQCFFNDRHARRRTPLLLDLVDSLDQFTRNVGIQRHAARRELSRPMGGNLLFDWCSATTHDVSSNRDSIDSATLMIGRMKIRPCDWR